MTLDEQIADWRKRNDTLETSIRERGGFTTDEGIERLGLFRERQVLTRQLVERWCDAAGRLGFPAVARAVCSFSRTVVFRYEHDGWTWSGASGFEHATAVVEHNGSNAADLSNVAVQALQSQIRHADLDGIAYAPSVDFPSLQPNGQPGVPMRWTGTVWERVATPKEPRS